MTRNRLIERSNIDERQITFGQRNKTEIDWILFFVFEVEETHSVTSSAMWLWDSWNVRASRSRLSRRFLEEEDVWIDPRGDEGHARVKRGKENNMSTIGIIDVTRIRLFLRASTKGGDRFVQRMFQQIVIVRRWTLVRRWNTGKEIHALQRSLSSPPKEHSPLDLLEEDSCIDSNRTIDRVDRYQWQSEWSNRTRKFKRERDEERWSTNASSSKISKRIRQYSKTHSTMHVQRDFIPKVFSLLLSSCCVCCWSLFCTWTLNVTPEGRAKKLLWSRINTVLFRWWSIPNVSRLVFLRGWFIDLFGIGRNEQPVRREELLRIHVRLTLTHTRRGISVKMSKPDLRLCDDYLQFQNHLKELRKLDDLIINTLNTTVLTSTFRAQGSDASKQCQQLGDQVFHFSFSLSLSDGRSMRIDLDRLSNELPNRIDFDVFVSNERSSQSTQRRWSPTQSVDLSTTTVAERK